MDMVYILIECSYSAVSISGVYQAISMKKKERGGIV